MARPQKAGLDYFDLDTDFDSDDKIELILALHSNEGVGIIIRLWARMYRTTDGELDLSDPDVTKTLCKRLSVTPQKLDKVIATACKCGLFSSCSWTEARRLANDRVKRSLSTIEGLRRAKRGKYAQTSEFRHDFAGVSDGRNVGETPQSKDRAKTEQSKGETDKEKTTTPTPSPENGSSSAFMTSDLITLKTRFRENNVPITPYNLEIIEKKYGLDVCTKALREAINQGHPEYRYIAGILSNWEVEGLPDVRAGPRGK